MFIFNISMFLPGKCSIYGWFHQNFAKVRLTCRLSIVSEGSFVQRHHRQARNNMSTNCFHRRHRLAAQKKGGLSLEAFTEHSVELVWTPENCGHVEQCVVCQQDFRENGPHICTKLECGHVFHSRCIMRWLATHTTCPMCQMDLKVGFFVCLDWISTRINNGTIESGYRGSHVR